MYEKTKGEKLLDRIIIIYFVIKLPIALYFIFN